MKPLLYSLLAAALSWTAPLTQAKPDSESRGQPNILFIAIDDLKPILGCYGDEMVHSPEIDALAARGTTFLNNHCQQAVCGPSRASLMTGLRPDSTEVYDLKTRMRDRRPDIITIPQHLRNAGYVSVGMGKIFDPRCVDGRKFADKASWSEPFMYAYGKGDREMGYLNPETVAWIRSQKGADGKPLDRSELSGRPATEGSEDVPDNAYDDGATTDLALKWIDKLANEEEPFFLAVGFKKPHLPFVAPKRYWDLYDREQFSPAAFQKTPEGTPEFTTQPGWELRSGYDVPAEGVIPEERQKELMHGYYACVSYIDAQVGKLMDALEAEGIADNTIVIIWGDHGWHLGDHAMWCKHSNYEQATRSPLIIVEPGQKAPGGKVKSPTEFTDLFPTICDLVGVQAPDSLEGKSLRPLLEDPAGRVRELAMSQYPRNSAGTRLMGYTYRGDRHRLTIWKEMDVSEGDKDGPVYTRELYDYEKDPLETRNLIEDPDYREVVESMEAAVKAYHSPQDS